MMVPNASVTIARYGPVTRSAGSASTAPNAAAIRMAAGSVTQIGICRWKNSTPATYEPMPNRPAWPSDTWPV